MGEFGDRASVSSVFYHDASKVCELCHGCGLEVKVVGYPYFYCVGVDGGTVFFAVVVVDFFFAFKGEF